MPNVTSELEFVQERKRTAKIADLLPRVEREQLVLDLERYIPFIVRKNLKRLLKEAVRYLINDGDCRFGMNIKEARMADEWIAEHSKVCKLHIFSYEFEPTGIGVGIDVKCKCGAKQDITDIDCW